MGSLSKKILFGLAILFLLTGIIIYESNSSFFQSIYFSWKAKSFTYNLDKGVSSSIRYPTSGPYDVRLGYTGIPKFIQALGFRNYEVSEQAKISASLASHIDKGMYAVYEEKTAAGLRVDDLGGATIFQSTRPTFVYKNFSDIPEIIIKMLLFIENREILDTAYPYKNPAVEWDRFARAALEKLWQVVDEEHDAPGGSTIPTQLEKYRHSAQGRTRQGRDKITQMFSATYRAYLQGRDTREVRKQIVMRYINSIPLAALKGYGEVTGLGDGAWAWYDLNFAELNRILSKIDKQPITELSSEDLQKTAQTLKQALSLFIAHRRPSFYLLHGNEQLDKHVNSYLNLLVKAKILNKDLASAAQAFSLKIKNQTIVEPPETFIQRKTANSIRTTVLKMLGLERLYELDALDLVVKSTLAKKASDGITQILTELKDKKKAFDYGLGQARNLDRGDPAKVIYSFTLYEHVGDANLLRVQTDNWDRPFNLNEGARMDLGSTAKLRTLVTYLELIADIYERVKNLSVKEKQKILSVKPDILLRWVVENLIKKADIDLKSLLELAMQRTYSASTGEKFFTGGGIHTFSNFKNEDNGKVVTLNEAIRHSINLPFIRLMRDIARHYEAEILGAGSYEKNSDATKREKYLYQFADNEGKTFLAQFYKKFKANALKNPLVMLVEQSKRQPKRLAQLYRFTKPQASFEEFKTWIAAQLAGSEINSETLLALYRKNSSEKFSLQDQGYIVGLHPLELWLARYMLVYPEATLRQCFDASVMERREAYTWLYKPTKKQAQDKRIKVLLEMDAFLKIQAQWKKVGYPFANIVPSYATAIGSSGDRPAALADLVGIILNNGLKYPAKRIEEFRFAENTPFETRLTTNLAPPERVLREEVSQVVKTAMIDIAENGTARRIKDVFKDSSGNVLKVGGKTGTGDQRFETFGAGGGLVSSRVVSRTATFVFFIGDRFYGVVSAHVQGQEAAKFDFTSALAVEVLKICRERVGEMWKVKS